MPLLLEPWSLVHNFGDYSAGEREDLIQLVPSECKRILDIGCAEEGMLKSFGSRCLDWR
ncbi:MAG: hypothetical protein U5L00_21260 [Desulfovermiculus sp.]|nr:hypothetical protein [Desulfovermiculus sp.]